MDQGTRGGEEEWNELGDWGGHVFTSRCKADNSGVPAVERRELSSVLCDDLGGVGGDTCVHRADSRAVQQKQLF